MPAPTIWRGDVSVDGNFSARAMAIPPGSVNDAAILPSPGTYIQAEKLMQQARKAYSQPNVAAVSETKFVHRIYGAAATIIAFHAGIIGAATGAATVTVDLRKNGVSVLGAVINITNSLAAYGSLAAAISSTGCVAGDVLTVVVVATAGGGVLPTGLFAEVVLDENPV